MGCEKYVIIGNMEKYRSKKRIYADLSGKLRHDFYNKYF